MLHSSQVLRLDSFFLLQLVLWVLEAVLIHALSWKLQVGYN